MAERIVVPRIGWSGHVVLRSWLKEDGVWVTAGMPICVVAVDDRLVPLAAHTDGFLHVRRPTPRPGTRLLTHQELGVVLGSNESREAASWGPGLPPRTALRLDWRLATDLARQVPLQRRSRSTPRARRTAAEAGLKLKEITGTGRNGRIRDRDVRHAATFAKSRRASVVLDPEVGEEGKSTVIGAAPAAAPPAPPPDALPATPGRLAERKLPATASPPSAASPTRAFQHVQSAWDMPSEASASATAGRPARGNFASQAPEWGVLLQRLGALLLAHPTLLARPRDITGVIRIRIQAFHRDQPVQWTVSWSAMGDPEELLRSTRKEDEQPAHFDCYDLTGWAGAATAPLLDTQRAALTIGTPQLTPLAARPNVTWVWRRQLTLTYDPNAVGFWEAATLLQLLTASR